MERNREKCCLMVGEHESNLRWEEGWRGMRIGEVERRWMKSGAALVACLSMEHITTGFDNQVNAGKLGSLSKVGGATV